MSFSKSAEFYAPLDNSEFPFVLFGNSATGQYGSVEGSVAAPVFMPRPFEWGAFEPIDLKPYGVTADANFANLGGILIVTGAADLFLAFRAGGSTTLPSWQWYQQQMLEASPQGGQRSVCYDTIPLVNGCFEFAAFAKNYPDDGGSPNPGTINSVGWNLKLKGWGC